MGCIRWTANEEIILENSATKYLNITSAYAQVSDILVQTEARYLPTIITQKTRLGYQICGMEPTMILREVAKVYKCRYVYDTFL